MFAIILISTMAISFVKSQRLVDVDAMQRIIHGRVVDISDYPYQVAILMTRNGRKRIICGGALVGRKVVYTAAHCTHATDFRARPNLSVLVGANSLDDPMGEEHSIDRVMKHPDFSYDGYDNDFSVIVLDEPVEFGERVQTIAVSRDDHRSGSRARVSGWGRTESGPPSTYLRATELHLEDWARCQNHFPSFFHPKITRNMICIKPDHRSTYFGDSGGPLTIGGKLVGLVSFGRTISGNKKVTVFTRVKNFLNFAAEVVDDDSD